MNDWTDYLSTLPVTRGQRAEVLATSELRRIRDAARYVWQDEPRLAELVARRTEQLRQPLGQQTLRPVQAVVLSTLAALRGCFAPVRTGGGKTLISLLAAEVLDAKRPVLLVPASLRDKTRREAHALAAHWRIRPLRIISYESLGRLAMADALERFEADLLVCDESHYLKNTKAACTRRVKRYLQKHPTTSVLCMSGSITSRTLRDYWHQLRWCLGDAMPLPREVEEVQQWSWALDEKVADGMRWAPGALLALSMTIDDDPPEPLAAARARYGRRLMSTPGVVGSGGDMPPAGLICRVEHFDPSPAVKEAVDRMRATWETPCGLPFETAMDLWRHERELSAGMYYRWTERPPFEWLTARKAWSAFCRETLSRSRTLDTPLAVAKAIHDGKLDDGGLLAAWQAVEPSFDPVTEAVWICDDALNRAAVWLEQHPGGLCWVHHGAFGRRLSQVTGIPYFSQLGRADGGRGVAIDEYSPALSAIVSLSSCSRGFNLQARYQSLITTCPTKNNLCEQTISRIHRDGQEHDDVEIWFPQVLEGDRKALQQARADATYVESTTLQPQRLGIATWLE